MRLFRRAPIRPTAGRRGSGDEVSAVVVDEDDITSVARRARDLAALRAITAEAVILQDEAEEVLAGIRARGPLGELAPRCGPLGTRFQALRRRLPESRDPAIRKHVDVLRVVFDHHTVMLASCLDLLAADWRSERVVEQLEKLDGLGPPALRLEAVRAELLAASPPS